MGWEWEERTGKEVEGGGREEKGRGEKRTEPKRGEREGFLEREVGVVEWDRKIRGRHGKRRGLAWKTRGQ
jgi:hypothetical protein